ncbi:alpha-L-arabinofuranosidase domain protein [Russula earlei]|uniref:Alpha-L-arabinofuranosidase domain protein n=1 Tax=Russula earlei TaxID=71964 RepID=A0ACC0TYS7_9AGAM|nr:alpha-L-arabinofuranosidase domain protein [Russula earlei]
MKKTIRAGIIATACFLIHTAHAQKQFIVKANEVKATIQPTMWGIFFEDINFGADGGLYAELVKNRSFEFNMPMMGWKLVNDKEADASTLIINRQQANTVNPRFIRVSRNNTAGTVQLINEGFKGMGIKQNEQYNFSGNTLAEGTIHPTGNNWQLYKTNCIAAATEAKAVLSVAIEGKGSIDMDMISLFPEHTWKNRPGGLRADLVQLLADLHPGFLRFPGGCIVEGRDLATRYQWKKTIGDVNKRKLIINRWNTEFAHRPAPDYYQSFGLGFYEYFQLAEDLGASPLPILNCGMACQFNTAEVADMEQIDPYVQDALDLVEFANGDLTTKWGALRASLGHPAPFNLKMMGIGNEQWGPQFIERYRLFAKAIKSKYPTIQLINSVGPDPDGDKFTYLNDTLRKLQADVLDEHYYRSPSWFFSNAKRYDQYPRNGSKIFAGEYAAQSVVAVSPLNRNNWLCALSEAAFMTGLERNADVVSMASYAPLLAHTEGWQWTPDLIWFDNLHAYPTPNYYVQKLYGNNKGTQTVPITLNNEAVAGQDSLYASAAIDQTSHELIIKIVNAAGKAQQGNILLEGINKLDTKAQLTLLQNNNTEAVNSFDGIVNIAPQQQEMAIKDKTASLLLAPYSFAVIRIKIL